MNDDFIIYADKTRISQVISNLISNSIKFISDEKEKRKYIYNQLKKSKDR